MLEMLIVFVIFFLLTLAAHLWPRYFEYLEDDLAFPPVMVKVVGYGTITFISLIFVLIWQVILLFLVFGVVGFIINNISKNLAGKIRILLERVK